MNTRKEFLDAIFFSFLIHCKGTGVIKFRVAKLFKSISKIVNVYSMTLMKSSDGRNIIEFESGPYRVILEMLQMVI